MKKEIVITVIVVVALITGILYYKSIHRATLGTKDQPTYSPDWRSTVGHNNTARTPNIDSDDPLIIIPELPVGSYSHESQGHSEPSQPPFKTRNMMPSDENLGDEDELPYWESLPDVANDNPEFYQPSDDDEQSDTEPALVEPNDDVEAAL